MELSCTQAAKLVLGYLKSENCMKAHNEFLRSCRHLKNVSNKPGKSIATRVQGMNLIEILADYAKIYTIIQEKLEETDFFNDRNRSNKLSHQLRYLLDDHIPSRCSTPNFMSRCSTPHRNILIASPTPSLDINTTQLKNLPGNLNNTVNPKSKPHLPTIQSDSNETETDSLDEGDGRKNESAQFAVQAFAQSLLDQHELTRKLAENINLVIENKEKLKDGSACDDIDSAIKAVLDKTESDPAFDTLMGEIIGSVSAPLNHNIIDALPTVNKDILLSPHNFNSELLEQNKMQTPLTYPPLNIDIKNDQQTNLTVNTNTGDIILYDGSMESYMKKGLLKTQQQPNIEIQNPAKTTPEGNNQTNISEQDILKMPTIIVTDEKAAKHVKKPAVKKVKTMAPRQTPLSEFITLYKCGDEDNNLNKPAECKGLKTIPPKKKTKEALKYEIHIPIENRQPTPADNIIATASYPNGFLSSGIPECVARASNVKSYGNCNPNKDGKKRKAEQIAVNMETTQNQNNDQSNSVQIENKVPIDNSTQLSNSEINDLNRTENNALSGKSNVATMTNHSVLQNPFISNEAQPIEIKPQLHHKQNDLILSNNMENNNQKQAPSFVIENDHPNVLILESNKSEQIANSNNKSTFSQNESQLNGEGIDNVPLQKDAINFNKNSNNSEIAKVNQNDNGAQLNEKDVNTEMNKDEGAITKANNSDKGFGQMNKIVNDLQSIQSQTDILKSIQAHSENLLAKNESLDVSKPQVKDVENSENPDGSKKPNNRKVTITDLIDVKKFTPEVEVKKKEITPGEKAEQKKNSSTPRSGNKSHVRALDFKFNTPPSSDLLDIKTVSPSKRKSPSKAKTAKSLFKSPTKTSLIVKKKELVKPKRMTSWDADLRNQLAEDPIVKNPPIVKPKPKKPPAKPKTPANNKNAKKANLKSEEQSDNDKPAKRTRSKLAKSPQKVITVTTDLQNSCLSIIESEGKVEDVLKSNENSQITLINCNAKPRYNKKCNIDNPTRKDAKKEAVKVENVQAVKIIEDRTIVKQTDIEQIEINSQIEQIEIKTNILNDPSMINKCSVLNTDLNESSSSLNKRTILDMEDLIKIDSRLESGGKFLTPELIQPKVPEIPVTMKKNIIPTLETPVKDIYPKTPSALSPATVEDTPFTKVFKDTFANIDLAAIQTPKFLNTPNFPFTPLLDGQSPHSNRGTDYSTSSSYYQPSDTEQNKCLEMFIKEECKRPQPRRITPIKIDEPMDIEKVMDNKIIKSTPQIAKIPPATEVAEKAMVEKMKSFSGNMIARKNLSLMPRKDSSDESSSDESSDTDTSDSSRSSSSEEDSVIKVCSPDNNITQYSLRSSKGNTTKELSEPPQDDVKSMISVSDYSPVLPEVVISKEEDKKKKVLADLEIKRLRTLEKLKNNNTSVQKPPPRKRAPPKARKSPVKKAQPAKRNLRSNITGKPVEISPKPVEISPKPIEISPKQKLRTMMDMEMSSSDDDELKPLQVVETEMLSSKSNTPVPETINENNEKVLATFEEKLKNLSAKEKNNKITNENKDDGSRANKKENGVLTNEKQQGSSGNMSAAKTEKEFKSTKESVSSSKKSEVLSSKSANEKPIIDRGLSKKSMKEKVDGVSAKEQINAVSGCKSTNKSDCKTTKEQTKGVSNINKQKETSAFNKNNHTKDNESSNSKLQEGDKCTKQESDKEAQSLVDGLKERGIYLTHNKEKTMQSECDNSNSNKEIEDGEILSEDEDSHSNKSKKKDKVSNRGNKQDKMIEDLFGDKMDHNRKKSLLLERTIDQLKTNVEVGKSSHKEVKKMTKITDIVKKTVNTKNAKRDERKKVNVVKKQEEQKKSKDSVKKDEVSKNKDDNIKKSEALKNDKVVEEVTKSVKKKIEPKFDPVDTSLGNDVEFDHAVLTDIIEYVYNPNEKHNKIITNYTFLKQKREVDIYTEVLDMNITRPIEVDGNDNIFTYKPPRKRRAAINVIEDVKITNKTKPLKMLYNNLVEAEDRDDLTTSSPLDELYATENRRYGQQKPVQNKPRKQAQSKKEVKKSVTEKGVKSKQKASTVEVEINEEGTKAVESSNSGDLQPSIYDEIPATPVPDKEYDALMDYSLVLSGRKRKPDEELAGDNKKVKPENGMGILKKVDIENFLNIIHSTPN